MNMTEGVNRVELEVNTVSMSMTEGVNRVELEANTVSMNMTEGVNRVELEVNTVSMNMTEGVNTQSSTRSKHSLNEMKQTEDTSTFHIIFLTTRTEEVNITSVKRAEDI